jgi:hypothetical protein
LDYFFNTIRIFLKNEAALNTTEDLVFDNLKESLDSDKLKLDIKGQLDDKDVKGNTVFLLDDFLKLIENIIIKRKGFKKYTINNKQIEFLDIIDIKVLDMITNSIDRVINNNLTVVEDEINNLFTSITLRRILLSKQLTNTTNDVAMVKVYEIDYPKNKEIKNKLIPEVTAKMNERTSKN